MTPRSNANPSSRRPALPDEVEAAIATYRGTSGLWERDPGRFAELQDLVRACQPAVPKCCAAQTVTLRPPGNSRRLLQPDYWGSEDWTKIWNQRTYVESVFGVCKNADGENMHRGQHRLVGLAPINIMAAIVFAANNTRTLQQWFDRQPTVIDHPLNVRERERRHVMLYAADEVDDALKTQQDRQGDTQLEASPDPEAA